MKTTQQGIDLIKRFEGFSATPYWCPGGYQTIGYGHVIRPEESLSKKEITTKEAERLLKQDVVVAERAVRRFISIPLTKGQFDALVSFTFNLGSGALQRSTLRRRVNEAAHEEVPKELKKWVWAGGKRLKGLIKRRNAEIIRYRS
jgi:lysozyme